MWINEVDAPQRALIRVIKKTKKGLILITEDYDAFLFNGNTLGKHLLEALEYWHSSEDGLGFELFIVPDKKAKVGFTIEMGKGITYFAVENLWTIDEDEAGETNPFLSATPNGKQKATPNPFKREQARKAVKADKERLDEKTPKSLPDAS